MTLEAARGDKRARATYERALREVAAATAEGLAGHDRDTRALVVLALLAGGMSITHAVDDEAFVERIASAVTNSIAELESHQGM